MSDDLGHDERFQTIRRRLREGDCHPSGPVYELLDELEREHIVWEKHGLSEIVRERDAARQRIEELKAPTPDTGACQRCGRRDSLDAVLANDVWDRVSAAADGANLLCLWCIDELCGELDITTTVTLWYGGKHITGTSKSAADRDHTTRLCIEIDKLRQRIEELERLAKAVVESPTPSDLWDTVEALTKALA